ncbi:MAG TPA: hypothetical protein ENK06_03680 [Gammaproteobacteria bacterium]|nr:hypothetical protein [Gammaproteobacteria bacterium]
MFKASFKNNLFGGDQHIMFSTKLKSYVFKSKLTRFLGGAYLLYLAVLMVVSAQLGLQLGAELKHVPENQRFEYISIFLSEKL